MEERTIMNSQNLQSLFPKEYEEFFTKNNLIVSSPHVINRGNVMHLEGIKVRISQKMPTKLYIGVNMRKDDEVHFQTCTQFSHLRHDFEKKMIEAEWNTETLSKMKDAIKEKLSEFGVTQWIDISVLSENKKGTWIAMTSIESLLISLILHIIGNKVTIEQIADYDGFIQSEGFKSVYTTAKQMLAKVSWIPQKDINTNIFFTGAVDKGNIWLCLDSKEYTKATYPKGVYFDQNVCLDYIQLDPRKFVEYSIIDFGWCFDELYNTKIYMHEQEDHDDILKYYKMYEVKSTGHIDIINVLYLNFLKTAKEYMKNPNNDQQANNLFNSFNRIGSFQAFMEKYFNLYMDTTAIFKHNKDFDDERFGIIPISSAKPWGTFLCITQLQKSRETLQKIIGKIREMWHTTANFQYLSREDGISEEHLMIEQHMDKDSFSQYIKDSDVILEYYWTWWWKRIIGNHRELLKQAENSVVFDAIDGKIYTSNELTSHNEILTQSGTVDVMKVLFENMWSYVNNSKLPPSSYSKNKNEMTGKIIWPLQELVKKKFNEKLDLECTGNIVNFDLKLMPSKLNLHLIKKIHH